MPNATKTRAQLPPTNKKSWYPEANTIPAFLDSPVAAGEGDVGVAVRKDGVAAAERRPV